MDNILPKFQSFSLSKEETHHPSQWKPQDAVVVEVQPKKIAHPPPQKTSNYQTNLPPPNERYQKILHECDDPSPLSIQERGVPEKPMMNLINNRGAKSEAVLEKVVSPISITNGSALPIQLFYQNITNVLDITLSSGEIETRFPNGKLPKENSLLTSFEIFVASARRLSIVMSLKQHLQTYIFQPTGGIGIEVEMKNSKLICSRVFEGSQAWPYEKELCQAEIVGINYHRVLTLEEFRSVLVSARENFQIVVTQFGGDEILDELITFHKKSRKMARLVSGAFEEASAADSESDSLVSSSVQAEVYENISLEPQYIAGKSRRGIVELGDEAESKFESRCESIDSISIDPAEEAKAQANIMANPRRTSTVVESIEYMQEIGNVIENRDENSQKKSDLKEIMPTLVELDDQDEDNPKSPDDQKHTPANKESSPWNYATALDENDVTSHRHLSGWVNTQSMVCMQIANYSQSWLLDISWVGEDSGLVSRATLNSGDTHVEMMSHEHVWCLTLQRKSVSPDISMRYQVDESGNFPDDIPDLSSTSLLFRPPSIEKSTQFSPATSIIWIPWHSLAFAESSKQRINSNYGDETIDLFIKIFDSTTSDQKGKKVYRKK